MDRRSFLSTLGAASLATALPSALRADAPLPSLERLTNANAVDLLTRTIYDNRYHSIDNADQVIAKALFPIDLQTAVDRGIIPSYSGDFLIPLGLVEPRDGDRRAKRKRTKIDFTAGMRNMWNDKQATDDWFGVGPALRERRDHFVRAQASSLPSSLRSYRRHDIAEGIDVLRTVHAGRSALKDKHDKHSDAYKDGVREFMDVIVDTIKPNVFLGYNIQELFPPAIQGRPVNALAKAWFFDRLLKEGGLNVIEGYPARYDAKLSYGPFQIIDGKGSPMSMIIARNKYVPSASQVPAHVAGFRSMRDHVYAAAMLAHANWEWMAGALKDDRKRLQSALEKASDKERQLTVAGLTAAMHHQPSNTIRAVKGYAGRRRFDGMHYTIKDSLGPRLSRYYDSSAEAYLIMKVFHEHEEKFSPK